MIKLNLAADPEAFAKTESGIITSVAGLLGCSKEHKLDLNGIRIQEDNVLIEFDNDPYDEFKGFSDSIARGIAECEAILNPLGMSIAPGVSSHIFTEAELKSFDPSAFIFGCTPDFNAFTGMRNPKPASADAGLRTAGGHIHFGFKHLGFNPTTDGKIMGVMCDYALGLTSLLLDGDDRRRELYGKAGSVRFKPYGIEYRTLSNFWIFDKETRQWAWDQSQKAFNHLKDGSFMELTQIVSPEEIQRVINCNDRRMAEQYIKMTGIM
jgi:hypothetical protein